MGFYLEIVVLRIVEVGLCTLNNLSISLRRFLVGFEVIRRLLGHRMVEEVLDVTIVFAIDDATCHTLLGNFYSFGTHGFEIERRLALFHARSMSASIASFF